MSNNILFYRRGSLILISLMVTAACFSQEKFDSVNYKISQEAVYDWHPGLGLSKDQQAQLKGMEQNFFKKLNGAKAAVGFSRSQKSAELSKIYSWRGQEIARILTADQLKKFQDFEKRQVEYLKQRSESIKNKNNR